MIMVAALLCGATALAPPAPTGRSLATTRWQCAKVPGKWATRFFRLKNGVPECASLDGIKCLYNTDSGPEWCAPWTVAPKLDQLKLKPLTCGAPHARVWKGNTGFSEEGHWCNTVKAYFDSLLKRSVSNLPPGGACLGDTDCASGLCLPRQGTAKVRFCGCKANKDCGRVSYCSASKRQCVPKQTPNHDCPCGKQATEDYEGYIGSCIGRECFQCTLPEARNYQRAGPGDISNYDAYPYYCNLKTYTLNSTVLDIAQYIDSGTGTKIYDSGILVG